MKRPLDLLDAAEIADPCRAPWDGMSGTDRVRYCAECRQSVYDLSALTRSEALQLLGGSGDVCVRLARHDDRTVVTRGRRTARRIAAALTACFGMAGVVGCGEEPKQFQGKISVPAPGAKAAPDGPGH